MFHVILTRFNVRSRAEKEKSLRARPEWLAQRFKLFDDFCFPSVTAQTKKGFRWLVFFDAQTPEPYRTKINSYQALPEFQPVFVDDWRAHVVHDTIRAHAPSDCTSLLTTRLDNDDAIHPRFVETLLPAAKVRGDGFYNFSNGLIYRDGRVYSRRDLSNAFASLREPYEGFQTAWKVMHNDILGNHLLHQLDMPNAWLQVIHSSNVSNRVRGMQISGNFVRSDYVHLQKVTFQEASFLSRSFEFLVAQHLRASRDFVYSRLKCAARRFRTAMQKGKQKTTYPTEESQQATIRHG